MEIGTSQLTERIYVGKTRIDKNTGLELWTSKEDITEKAIKAVFEHMYLKAKETGAYQIKVEGFGKMTFVREDKGGKNNE